MAMPKKKKRPDQEPGVKKTGDASGAGYSVNKATGAKTTRPNAGAKTTTGTTAPITRQGISEALAEGRLGTGGKKQAAGALQARVGLRKKSQPAAAPKPVPSGGSKPRKPKASLEKLGMQGGRIGRQARAALSIRTGLKAGVGGKGLNSGQGVRRKTRTVTDRGGNVVQEFDSPIPKGSIAYGGRTYDAGALDSLVSDIRKRGGNAENYLGRPGVAEALGMSSGQLSSYIQSMRLTSAARKAQRVKDKAKNF